MNLELQIYRQVIKVIESDHFLYFNFKRDYLETTFLKTARIVAQNIIDQFG